MLEYSWLGEALRAGNTLFGILYWGAAIGLAYIVWNWFKKPFVVPGLVVIALAFGYLPFTIHQEKKARQEYVTAAWAHFNKLCTEKAGIKVYKTVKGVDSVLITKPRPTVSADERELFDQFWRGDQYAGIAHRDGTKLIAAELFSSYAPHDNRTGTWPVQKAPILKFVEAVSESQNVGSKFVRYARHESGKTIEVQPVAEIASKYAVEWNDVSSDQDRGFWIAASHWRILDRESGTVLGERFGFAIEPGFGSRSGARRPWLFASREGNSCPPIEHSHNQLFIRKIFE